MTETIEFILLYPHYFSFVLVNDYLDMGRPMCTLFLIRIELFTKWKLLRMIFYMNMWQLQGNQGRAICVLDQKCIVK